MSGCSPNAVSALSTASGLVALLSLNHADAADLGDRLQPVLDGLERAQAALDVLRGDTERVCGRSSRERVADVVGAA